MKRKHPGWSGFAIHDPKQSGFAIHEITSYINSAGIIEGAGIWGLKIPGNLVRDYKSGLTE